MAYQAEISAVDHCIVNVRADPVAMAAIETTCGIALPVKPNSMTNSGRRSIVWAGPDRWLILSGDHGDEVLVGQINQAALGLHGNATLISDQYAGYVLTGAQSRNILAQGCALDLDRFMHGQSAVCAFARTSAIIVPLDHDNDYLLLFAASLAEYFEEWFVMASGRER